MKSSGVLVHSLLRSRLTRAREAEHIGDYDRAARILADDWDGPGSRPLVEDLGETEGAELLLRAGALTGYLGSSAQTPGAQERALDLLSEAHAIFTRLGLVSRAAETRIELATCYRRQGFYDAARAMLDSATELLGGGDPYLLGLAAIRRAITENCAGNFEEALGRLADAEETVRAAGSHALSGRFYNEYGAGFFLLCEREGKSRWGEALGMFAAALCCFERAGHLRYCTIAENNIGFSLVKLGRLAEAHKHIQNARRFAQCVDDRGQLSLIDDTYSQLLVEQDRLVEAEAVIRARLEEMEGTDHNALLSENLTTHAVTLARLGRSAEAAEVFERAEAVAAFAGDQRGAERAATAREAELGVSKVLPFRKREAALSFEWRVSDESLRGIGIRKGDAVYFAVSDKIRDGDLVAVLTPAGRFIKLAYMESGGRVRLEGAHPRCRPRLLSRADVNFLGVVAGQGEMD